MFCWAYDDKPTFLQSNLFHSAFDTFRPLNSQLNIKMKKKNPNFAQRVRQGDERRVLFHLLCCFCYFFFFQFLPLSIRMLAALQCIFISMRYTSMFAFLRHIGYIEYAIWNSLCFLRWKCGLLQINHSKSFYSYHCSNNIFLSQID